MKSLILLFLLCLQAHAVVIPDKDVNGKIIQTTSPFSAKDDLNFHGTGYNGNCANGNTTDLDYTIPTGIFLLTGIQVLNGQLGDVVDFQIVDTPAGTYSTVPNAVLNQFAYSWNISSDTKKTLPYDATLYTGMKVRVKYTNNGGSSRVIYVNLDLHKKN